MGESGGIGVGTDFNGLAQQPRGRFAGATTIGSPRRVRYGIDHVLKTAQVVMQPPEALTQAARAGSARAFDFNTDGLAHYGLLPDFLRDVANQFGSEQPLVPFFRSAQRFIEMWERCLTASAHV